MRMRVQLLALGTLAIGPAFAIPLSDALPAYFDVDATRLLDVADGTLGKDASWLARWLALGGEGEVSIKLPNNTLLLPHRPASFPTFTYAPFQLPLAGRLISITDLPDTSSLNNKDTDTLSSLGATSTSFSGPPSPSEACGPTPPFPRWTPPHPPYTIALIERGSCDFAHKVLYAQERGAAGVIVGDARAYVGESDEEGRERRALLTMFSPGSEDVRIPSVFVSRASYLLLRDLLRDNATSLPPGRDGDGDERRDDRTGLWVELGEAVNEGGMLSFALLMPSAFLLFTVAIHRIRTARQRQLDRAPAEVVLSLPERVWQPDLVWEKDSSSSSPSSPSSPTIPSRGVSRDPSRDPARHTVRETSNASSSHSIGLPSTHVEAALPGPGRQRSASTLRSGPLAPRAPSRGSRSRSSTSNSAASGFAPLPPISGPDAEATTDAGVDVGAEGGIGALPASEAGPSAARPAVLASGTKTHKPAGGRRKRTRTKSHGGTVRYYSQDECAICMDNFAAGDIVRILPCGHVFHKDECDEWLMKWRKLCPTCRADVTLPARAMVGSRITPVLYRDPLSEEPGVIGGDRVRDEAGAGAWSLRGVRSAVGGAMRGWGAALGRAVRRPGGRGGERAPLVPRGGDEEG